MLCRILKLLISTGRTDGLTEKIDVFYALNRLTDDEYTELTELLPG